MKRKRSFLLNQEIECSHANKLIPGVHFELPQGVRFSHLDTLIYPNCLIVYKYPVNTCVLATLLYLEFNRFRKV